MDHDSNARPSAQMKESPPLRTMLKRGERYVKLYRTMVTERAATVPRETARSYSSMTN